MKLKIGHVYKFNYQKLHESKTVADNVEVRLTKKALNSLVKDLVDTAAEREEYFIAHEKELKDYIKDLKGLEKAKSKRIASGKKQKSADEKNYEEWLELGRLTFFNNEKETRKIWKARNLFIRNFIPLQMTDVLDISEENEDAATSDCIRTISAVYGGKHITVNGKLVYTWYLTEWATLNKAYIKGLEQYLTEESF